MICGQTKVLGVIGDPVGHSASPAMHNAAIQALGLDYVYVAFHVPAGRAAEVGGAMRALQITGLNVTVPHKEEVMGALDTIADEARAIGAVNTILNEQGHLTGHNTDAHGIITTLAVDGGLQRLPSQVVLLGAGGAARAILYALLRREEVEEVTLLNRTAMRAQRLAAELDPAAHKVRLGTLAECDCVRRAGLLINATSIGMQPDEGCSPVADPSCLHRDLVVLDIVYRPLNTLLLRQAKEAGARTVDGLGMLVHQGARALQLWTGQQAPVEVMRDAITPN